MKSHVPYPAHFLQLQRLLPIILTRGERAQSSRPNKSSAGASRDATLPHSPFLARTPRDSPRKNVIFVFGMMTHMGRWTMGNILKGKQCKKCSRKFSRGFRCVHRANENT